MTVTVNARPLNIWLATTGETLPCDGEDIRLWRTGMVARHMAAAGHRVTWWTSDFIHTAKRHRFGRDTTIDRGDGIRIELLHSCGYTRHVGLRRLVDHNQVARSFRRRCPGLPRPDVAIICYPTIELAAACAQHCNRLGVPCAIDVRDAWPDIFLEACPRPLRTVGRIALRPYQRLARSTLLKGDALISLTEPFLTWALTKAGRARNEFDTVIPMSYDPPTENALGAHFDEGLFPGFRPGIDFGICLFCTFGRQYDILTVLNAACRLEEGNGPRVHWFLCGDGESLTAIRDAAKGLSTVHLPGWMDRTKMGQVMSASDAGLAPYHPERNFSGNIPNKPVEYLSHGLPVISCLGGVLNDLLTKKAIGFPYAARDAESLVEAVRRLIAARPDQENMRRRASNVYRESFHPDIVMRMHSDFIVRLAKGGRAGSRQGSGP